MNSPKPCPSCKHLPYVGFNDLVWICQCRNRACLSVEATVGVSGMAEHIVVNNWNNVIVPSVENSMREEYENTKNDSL